MKHFTLITCLLALLFSGCVRHVRYRSDYPARHGTITHGNFASPIEQTTNYLLGVIEIDDQGWLWDRKQMERVMEWIEDEKDVQHGLQLFVFVHGWQHNAHYEDENLKMFRNMLTALDEVERKKAGERRRKTVGVYVGWRGATQFIPGVQTVTFWNRKRTAHEVGRGALSEVLLRIEKFVNETKRQENTNHFPSRLVVIGHSFGGAATYSALAPIFLDRVLQSRTEDTQREAKGFGDLVMLINPAFEAARYGVLRDAARAEWGTNNLSNSRPASHLNLLILTSRGDAATGTAFPIGRAASALFQAHKDSTQHRANLKAIGYYKPFITHDLEARPKQTSLSNSVPAQLSFEKKKKTDGTNVTQIAQEAGNVLRTTPKGNTKARETPLRLSRSELKGRAN
ncbi:MAG TPA: hypothetical protein VNT99_06900, partial [Methylomirabilota bacterium]|nr:hypothetical protein [Methylomirabilota bacterium]